MSKTNMTFIQSISNFISSNISYHNREPTMSPYILSTSPPDNTMELYILKPRLQVCSIPKNDLYRFCHAIIKIALLPDSRPNFFSITESNGFYTLILTDEDFKEFPCHESLTSSGHGWRVLTISVGAMGVCSELVGVSKISKSVIGPLADNNISILCVSTYQSDFILVRENQLGEAVTILGNYFKIFNEDHQRVSTAQMFATTPKSPASPKVVRPIRHQFKSPEPQYHVTGLDVSKLSGVIQILLELLFYSGNAKDSNAEVFFHFSVVCGDISLILNDNAINKFPNNVLYTRKNEETWRMVIIGEGDLGFDECGIVAQVVEPLAAAQVSTYYVSTFNLEYCMVLEKDIDQVFKLLEARTLDNIETTQEVETKTQVASDSSCLPLGASLGAYSTSPQTPSSESSYGTSPPSDSEDNRYSTSGDNNRHSRDKHLYVNNVDKPLIFRGISDDSELGDVTNERDCQKNENEPSSPETHNISVSKPIPINNT